MRQYLIYRYILSLISVSSWVEAHFNKCHQTIIQSLSCLSVAGDSRCCRVNQVIDCVRASYSPSVLASCRHDHCQLREASTYVMDVVIASSPLSPRRLCCHPVVVIVVMRRPDEVRSDDGRPEEKSEVTIRPELLRTVLTVLQVDRVNLMTRWPSFRR